MNKKLIAAAVSAAVVAPVASHADVVLYGRINNAIDMNDIDDSDDADSTTNLSTVASRIGVRANAELNNGLSVHGHYEFSTTTDKEKANENADPDDEGSGGIEDVRVATVGVSGDFGRIDVGNQWSAYNKSFGTMVSPTYSLGYYLYSSVGGGLFRASNTIQYSNSFGPVTAYLDVRLNDGSDPEGGGTAEKANGDGFGLGLSFAVTDNISIAVAFDSEDEGTDDAGPATVAFTDGQTTANDGIIFADGTTFEESGSFAQDQDRMGVAAKGTFGGFWVTVGWQNHSYDDLDVAFTDLDLNDDGTVEDGTVEFKGLDTDTLFVYGGGSFSEQTSWMLGYAKADDGVDGDEVQVRNGTVSTDTDDSTQAILGVYHNVGGGLRLYYEGVSLDSENNTWDGARHLLGMRVDF